MDDLLRKFNFQDDFSSVLQGDRLSARKNGLNKREPHLFDLARWRDVGNQQKTIYLDSPLSSLSWYLVSRYPLPVPPEWESVWPVPARPMFSAFFAVGILKAGL